MMGKVYRYIVLFALLGVVFAGCNRSKVIPDGDLRDILSEIYIANAYVSHQSTISSAGLDSIDIYRPILKKYGYTLDDLKLSMANFSKRKSIRLSDVLDDAITRLEREQAQYRYTVGALDSVDARAARRFRKEVFRQTKIEVNSLKDTSKLRFTIPVNEGEYNVKMFYEVDSLDKNPRLTASFKVINHRGAVTNARTNWLSRNGKKVLDMRIDSKRTDDKMVMVLTEYPKDKKELKKPKMTIDSVLVYYYITKEAALDSLNREFFDYKLVIDGNEYLGYKPTKSGGSLYLYPPRTPRKEGDDD